jgi:phosphoglucomutase
MGISPLARKAAPKEMLVDLARLEREYQACRPDVSDPNQRVIFGTSGRPGSSMRGTLLTRAPGNKGPIGGLKVVAASGWSAARPSVTESIYKIYAESFKDQSHMNVIVSEAEEIVNNALKGSEGQA